MIHEVDEALRRLVRDEALRGSPVEVALEAPTKDWSARRNAPTVNLYLYDLREDVRRRQQGAEDEVDGAGRVTGRKPAPRYLKLSYLISAWTQRPEDEHRLLSLLLVELFRWEAVPRRLLSGSLLELNLPVPMTVAQPPPEDRAFADVWSALGGELKPSIDVVVSAPLQPPSTTDVGPPVTEGLRLDLGRATGLTVGDPALTEADDRVGHQVAGSRVAMRRTRG